MIRRPPRSTLFPYTSSSDLRSFEQFRRRTEISLQHGGFRDSGIRRVDRKSTRLNSSHTVISYAVFCLKKKNKTYLPRKPLLQNQLNQPLRLTALYPEELYLP